MAEGLETLTGRVAGLADRQERTEERVDQLDGRVRVLEREEMRLSSESANTQADISEIKAWLGKATWLMVSTLLGVVMQFFYMIIAR